MKVICEQCGQEFDATNRRGITPRFCSATCRQRAHRARKARQPLSEFRSERRWVRADGKRPIMPCGSPASSTNPGTWSTFAEVQASTAGDGFGVMLGSGLGCIDIDNCFDGDVVAPWASDYVNAMTEPILFVERSVSGRGLHVFFRPVAESAGTRRAGIERYTRQRFIRTTFDSFTMKDR